MRPVLALVLALGLTSPAFAAPASQPAPKITVNGKTLVVPTPASQPTSQPTSPSPTPLSVPGVPQPQDAQQALESGKTIVSALKAHRWWFASAAGIFLLMFLLNVVGVFKKIGTTWAWVTVGALSIAAACFAAFDAKGASWPVFLGIITSGPTAAWLRDFWKDVFLAKFLPWLKSKFGKKQ